LYLNYEGLKKEIEKFKRKTKKKVVIKLPGYYVFLKNSESIIRLRLDHVMSKKEFLIILRQ